MPAIFPTAQRAASASQNIHGHEWRPAWVTVSDCIGHNKTTKSGAYKLFSFIYRYFFVFL